MKKLSIWKVLLIMLAVIVIGVIVGITIYNNSDAVKLKKQLDFGQKYLAEMNYEEAVVAFNQAIEIDSRNAEAYLGLADAYLGMGNEEAALEALEAGYEATSDERLQERIDEMRAAAVEREREAAEAVIEREREAAEAVIEREKEAAEENERIAERVEEISQFITSETPINSVDSDEHFLTYDQIETFCRPLAEQLEMYLEQGTGDWEATAWCRLAEIYCHMSEMDKCLETRRRGYEATEDEALIPEQSYLGEQLYDEYGRFIDSEISEVYGEGDRIIMEDRTTLYGYPDYTEYEYDDLGRILNVYTRTENPGLGEILSESSYEYQSDNSVIVTMKTESDMGSNTGTYTLIYNEYGKVVDRTEIVYVWS